MAIDFREHDVEDSQITWIVSELFQCLEAVSSLDDLIVLGRERIGYGLHNHQIVIRDEDPLTDRHWVSPLIR
jgi:hypothetical protein